MSVYVREPWGETREGERVELVTLEGGMVRARFTNYGAALVSLEVPGRDGERADVVLGFDSLAEYESPRNPHCGGIVGRCANRIAGARFTLDGREHVLAANEGKNHIHGGLRGFDRRVWGTEIAQGGGIRFHHRSQDGEEGYPGELEVSASYSMTGGPERWLLSLQVSAHARAPTPFNPTQHSYFNLAGSGTILDHELQVFASRYVVVDDELIPTGELAGVEGTPFDFRTPRRIGERIHELETTPARGYDFCYALDGCAPAARLCDPVSGRTLEIHTDQPGLQLYTGNRLDGLRGKNGAVHPRFGALCLEAQGFPDAVHHAHFPSVVLRPYERYQADAREQLRMAHRVTIWMFSAE